MAAAFVRALTCAALVWALAWCPVGPSLLGTTLVGTSLLYAQNPPAPTSAPGARSSLTLSEDRDAYAVAPHLAVLEDTSGTWSVADVTAAPLADRFRPVGPGTPAFGYGSDAYWLRLTIDGTDVSAASEWLLELSNKSLDHVSLYVPRADGGYREVHTGDAHPFSDRPISHRNFVLPLPEAAGATRTLYLRLASEGPLAFPLDLWSGTGFARKDRASHFFLGIFFGALLIMALYNFFLFAAIRDYSYLYYLLYITSFIAYQLSVERLLFAHLWPDQVWWQERANSTLALFCAIWAIQFARSFLDTRRLMPRADRWLLALLVACVPLMGLNAVGGDRSSINVLVVTFFIVAPTALIATGVVALLRGSRMAPYFLGAWGFLLTGLLVTMLSYLGWLPYHFWSMRAVQVGSLLEVTLLLLGLGHRHHILRRERERMRLRIASDLHDDVGSGLTQISLYSELARRTPPEEADAWADKIGTLARTLTERMQDIVWAITPEQEHWESLELRMKDYGTGLLAPREIAFDMRGEADDPHQELTPVVRQNVLLMFKEIVHNAVRHADCSTVEVRWTLTQHALWLRICDDGRGFDPSAARLGNGLANLQRRADEIGATLTLDATPGQPTCYELDVPLRWSWTSTGRRPPATASQPASATQVVSAGEPQRDAVPSDEAPLGGEASPPDTSSDPKPSHDPQSTPSS